MEKAKENIKKINDFLLNSNCSDFRAAKYDKCKLHLTGSFDLCYYHEIEIIFHEVFRLSLETDIYLDLVQTPFHFCPADDDMIEVSIVDNSNMKHIIVCESIDVIIGLVKYA